MLEKMNASLRVLGYGVVVVAAVHAGEHFLMAGYTILFIEASVHAVRFLRSAGILEDRNGGE